MKGFTFFYTAINATASSKAFRMGRQKQTGTLMTLCKKELRQKYNTPAWIMNTDMGTLMAVILTVALIVAGKAPVVEVLEEVFIILDKLDKIGAEGVKAELLTLGLEESAVDAYLALFENGANTVSEFCAALPEEILSAQVPAGLDTILSCVAKALGENVTLKFDPTLVRGMGYYTGTIFEVKLNEYNFSIAGGGRYDEMIGKFSGQKTPACGFSICFEKVFEFCKEERVRVVIINQYKLSLFVV